MFFEHLQGWWLHHLPGQPVPMSDHTRRPSQPSSGQLLSKRIISDSYRRISSGKTEGVPQALVTCYWTGTGSEHVQIHLSISQSAHCDSLLQGLPALPHMVCPSTLLPQLFTKHPPAPFPAHASTPSPPFLRHTDSPLPKATCSIPSPSMLPPSPSMLPPSPSMPHHVHASAPEKPEETRGEAPTTTSTLQNIPSSALPPPPPLTFQKCFEGAKISSLSAKLACAPRQFQLATNVCSSALCSVVPACLFPKTSIVHYRRWIMQAERGQARESFGPQQGTCTEQSGDGVASFGQS